MKKLLFLFLTALAFNVYADTYSMQVGWTDPTPTGAGYTPLYDVEYRVTPTGAVTQAYNLASAAYTTTVTANPGQTIEARVRNKNAQGSLVSNWSAWVIATAQFPPTQPLDPSATTVTVTRTGS